MKLLLSVIVTLVCLLQQNQSEGFDEVIVRPDNLDDKPSLFRIARKTWDHARMKHFVEVPLECSFRLKLKLYCFPNDPSFCVFYDFLGNIAGVQISYLKDDVQNVDPKIYNFTGVKDFVHTNFFDKRAYSTRFFFTAPDELTEEGRGYVSEVAEGLWTTIDGRWTKISRCRPDGPSIGTLKLQGCYPRMGTIFINNLGSSDSCRDGNFFYTLYQGKSLVAFGTFVPGYAAPGPHRDWYSHGTEDEVKKMVPVPPQCFNEMKQFNFSSILVYLTSHIDKITCPGCFPQC